MDDLTQLLSATTGNPDAAHELLPLVYDELRKLARARMAREQPGQTLQPTALVHEAWLRLMGPSAISNWQNRSHFFAAAAEAMRRILVENARRKKRVKHGGGFHRLNLEHLDIAATATDDQLLAVHDSLEKLKERDPIGAELIKLRFFAGLSISEAAEILGFSERTGKRVWAYARAWLLAELKRSV
jgi:RNA polymerase sigma factor (TIGR02999 family)